MFAFAGACFTLAEDSRDCKVFFLSFGICPLAADTVGSVLQRGRSLHEAFLFEKDEAFFEILDLSSWVFVHGCEGASRKVWSEGALQLAGLFIVASEALYLVEQVSEGWRVVSVSRWGSVGSRIADEREVFEAGERVDEVNVCVLERKHLQIWLRSNIWPNLLLLLNRSTRNHAAGSLFISGSESHVCFGLGSRCVR